MTDAAAFEASFNRMLDGFAALIGQQQLVLERSARTMADAAQQLASQLAYVAATVPNVAGSGGAGQRPLVWWHGPDEPGEPFRDRWLGRRLVIRALGEADQYLMANMGRLVARAMQEVDRFLIANLGRYLTAVFEQADRFLMANMGRYVAAIMIEVNRSLGLLVQTHVQPYVNWMMRLLQTGITWLGDVFNTAIQWFTDAVQGSIAFLQDLIVYLYFTTVKALVVDLLDTVVYPFLQRAVAGMIRDLVVAFIGLNTGFLLALGNMFTLTIRKLWDVMTATVYALGNVFQLAYLKLMDAISAFSYGFAALLQAAGDWIGYSVQLVLTPLLRLLGYAVQPVQPAETPLEAFSRGWSAAPRQATETFEEAIARGFRVAPKVGQGTYEDAIRRGYQVGRDWAESLATPLMDKLLARYGLPIPGGTVSGPPPSEPRFGVPPFTMPVPVLPQPPAPVTLNGGISVTVNAGTVDAEHADEVARQIAGRVLDELHRLAEVERFSRGLPTGAAL